MGDRKSVILYVKETESEH